MGLFMEPREEAHGEILRSAGAWASHHRVLGRSPLPAGRLWELLTVDDHCGIALVSRTAKFPADDDAWQELEEIFVRSAAKNEEVEGSR